MGLHQRHNHGRVFRGLEAREQLHIHRRDSHGNTPVMHIPPGFDLQQKQAQEGHSVSVVYVTLPQTFSGPAIYRTLTAMPTAASSAEAHATPAAERTQAAQSPAHKGDKVTSSTVIASPAPSSEVTSAAALTSFATSTASAGSINQVSDSNDSPSVLAGSPIQATASPTSQVISQQQGEGGSGLSSGAQAGLAFGIIFSICLAAGLFYFCWRRQKRVRVADEVHNEKHASFADASARQVEAGAKRASMGAKRASTITEKIPESIGSIRSSRTTSTAPRLSLRPLTQFLPNLPASNGSLDMSAAGLSEKPKSSWERRPSNVGSNPFDDSSSEKQSRPNSPPQNNPLDESAAAAAKRSPKMSMEGSEPATPRSAQNGRPGPGPIAGASGNDNSAPRGPNNVHRVQLDFKPSMDDELELRSGQLVRMLHEYDDGWALCIRMDRSQQGVAPRTCLSKLPVKPRPQGPPLNGPNGRPGTSRGPGGPPLRPGGDMNGPFAPRPLTPTQARAPSPNDLGRETATSPVSAVPSRKPVPGQAM